MHRHRETEQQMKALRENLKLFREERGWLIDELSQLSGIDRQTIVSIENGEDIEAAQLFTLSDIYGIKPHAFFLGPDLDSHQEEW